MASQRWKTFENNISNNLSAWLFGEQKALRRTPCSGGWKGRGTGVDITVPDDRPDIREFDMFAFEVKCREEKHRSSTGWHFEQLLTCPKHAILDWWHGLTVSSPVKEQKKFRMLIFSKTSGIAKAYIALGLPEVKFFRDAGTEIDSVPKIIFEIARCEDPNYPSEVLHFFCFRTFLASIDSSKLKTYWRNIRNGQGA